MATTAESTLLSGILTATKGMVTSLNAVMKEQQKQGQQLKELAQTSEELKNRMSQLEDDVKDLTKNNETQWTETKELALAMSDEKLTNIHELLDEKLTKLVEAIFDDTEKEETKMFLEDMRNKLLNKTAQHQQLIVNKLDNMNQLEVLQKLIEALCTMQTDMSQLAESLIQASQDVSELSYTNGLMSSRLESVDLRLASFIADKEDVQDDDLNSLNDALTLLNQLQEENE